MHCCDHRPIPGVVIAVAVVLLPIAVRSQSAPQKLNLNAELVLTRDFCTAEMTRGSRWIPGRGEKEDFPVGAKLCPRLENELPSVFNTLRKVEQVPAPNTASPDLVLIPKIDDIAANKAMQRKRDLIVVLEWTALNREGKTVWVGTVQATGKEPQGSGFTHGKHLRKLSDDVASDAVRKSIQMITAAPELAKLEK